MKLKLKKINIVGPLLNKSQAKVQNDKNKLILPLSIIKGIGDVALNKILEVQSKINFEDFNDVVVKLKNNQVGDATLLTLIKANTLRLIANMNTLLNSLPIVIRYANLNLNIKDNDSLLEKPQLVVKEKDLDQEAKNEIEVFGFQINAFFTKKYESKTNLLNLPLNN